MAVQEPIECIDQCDPENVDPFDDFTPCEGEVHYRAAPSGSGSSYPRCEAHQREAEERMRAIDERYPSGPNPPSWFDPMDAGETW